MALPSSIVNPTFAGEISPGRSIIAISCSMGLPATTSATSVIVHFIHRAYATPQLCMLSRHRVAAWPQIGRNTVFSADYIQLMQDSIQIKDKFRAEIASLY
jgi:hypothetical protein